MMDEESAEWMLIGQAWKTLEEILPYGGEAFLGYENHEPMGVQYRPTYKFEAEAAPRAESDYPEFTWIGEPFQSQMGEGPTALEALNDLLENMRKSIEDKADIERMETDGGT